MFLFLHLCLTKNAYKITFIDMSNQKNMLYTDAQFKYLRFIPNNDVVNDDTTTWYIERWGFDHNKSDVLDKDADLLSDESDGKDDGTEGGSLYDRWIGLPKNPFQKDAKKRFIIGSKRQYDKVLHHCCGLERKCKDVNELVINTEGSFNIKHSGKEKLEKKNNGLVSSPPDAPREDSDDNNVLDKPDKKDNSDISTTDSSDFSFNENLSGKPSNSGITSTPSIPSGVGGTSMPGISRLISSDMNVSDEVEDNEDLHLGSHLIPRQNLLPQIDYPAYEGEEPSISSLIMPNGNRLRAEESHVGEKFDPTQHEFYQIRNSDSYICRKENDPGVVMCGSNASEFSKWKISSIDGMYHINLANGFCFGVFGRKDNVGYYIDSMQCSKFKSDQLVFDIESKNIDDI